jgi:hypothetical protein
MLSTGPPSSRIHSLTVGDKVYGTFAQRIPADQPDQIRCQRICIDGNLNGAGLRTGIAGSRPKHLANSSQQLRSIVFASQSGDKHRKSKTAGKQREHLIVQLRSCRTGPDRNRCVNRKCRRRYACLIALELHQRFNASRLKLSAQVSCVLRIGARRHAIAVRRDRQLRHQRGFFVAHDPSLGCDNLSL